MRNVAKRKFDATHIEFGKEVKWNLLWSNELLNGTLNSLLKTVFILPKTFDRFGLERFYYPSKL